MKLNRRTFVGAAAAAAAVPAIPSAQAQDAKLIKLGMCQDFTVVYTFVTAGW